MVLTADIHLPEESELTVEEINLSTATLRAGSFHLGKYCEQANNEFMLCRFEENDPRKCINEGKAVTACSLEFFRKVKKACLAEFNQYTNCIEIPENLLYIYIKYSYCRKTQGMFDKCMLENLNLERPPFGYFCEARVHETKRPKPPVEEKAVYPDATPGLPENAEKNPARFGSRFYWMTE
ncbi:NADH dehydrogenase [ubiquinone] 1 alpha subcomplex subunit 8 [Danaus plexippus plexippus]|uniref:NADH dehydrogenase [ubiquinone] 1 alpha subcomplex subunit 8 n=1 Tax=Danaus plexippus plexippus TaxID=278856 RepID=A0A212FCW1_DANPL|nr:NADH dehydrogenase [ubiquinone] 1 alpha subcomplex subunit 8 [Danaus plexippus plexippus]OWR51560.1 NADH dehydrogenase [ubiquinone] 1 alpha subcomplex subunit 8 [Danaus plexippus plexippus]